MPVCVCVGCRGKIERDREKQETSIRWWIPLCYPQHGQRNYISESETLHKFRCIPQNVISLKLNIYKTEANSFMDHFYYCQVNFFH